MYEINAIASSGSASTTAWAAKLAELGNGRA